MSEHNGSAAAQTSDALSFEPLGNTAAMYSQLLDVVKDLKPILKDSQGDSGRGKYTYAGLPTVLDAIRPALETHKILLMQPPIVDGKRAGAETILASPEKDWELHVRVMFPLAKSGPQDIGSVITYCRRYALLGILGLAPDDDDDGARQQQRHDSREARQAPRNGQGNGNGRRALAPPAPEKVIAAFAPYGVGEAALVAELNGTPLAALPEPAVAHLNAAMARLKKGEEPHAVFGAAAQALIQSPTPQIEGPAQ